VGKIDIDALPVIETIPGDASSRRYRRVRLPGGGTAVEVQYPPGSGITFSKDLEVRDWLERHRLRVPRLIAIDPATSRAVLEDFGPCGASATLRSMPSGARSAAARALVTPLEILARIDPATLPAWNAPLDEHRMRWELAGFELWFLRYGRGLSPSPAVGHWLDELAARVAAHPRRVCHRDYHTDNLFLLQNGEVGVIDFQDLLIGPESYDLVSLIGERDLPSLLPGGDLAEVSAEWARRTGAAPGWEDRLTETAAQRGLKVLGTFARLVASGREGYRRWLEELVPRQAALLRALGAPEELVAALSGDTPPTDAR